MASLNTNNDNRADQITKLKDLIAQKDERINNLFERLLKDTDGLEDSTLSLSKKNDIVVGVEFIVARLRFILCEELRFIEQTLVTLDGSDGAQKQVQTIFSKRKTYLLSIYGKVNDMREDLSLIEKTIYYNRY